MRTLRWFTLIVALPLFSGCGIPIQSGANFTPNWEPARQVTFAWRDMQDLTVGDSRLAGNEFFHQRLHEAVGWELALRGMRYSETNPDVYIHHHLSLADHERETEMVDKEGVVTTDRYVYENASLVVHLLDAGNENTLWIAWAEAGVEPAFRSPNAMGSWVYDLVGHMFKDWPLPPRL